MDKKLHIALDFDDTYTANPRMFEDIIKVIQEYGNKVSIVTLRDDQDRDFHMDYLKDEYDVDTIFCAGESKERVVTDLSIKIDIWMDDNPQYILNDYPDYKELWGKSE